MAPDVFMITTPARHDASPRCGTPIRAGGFRNRAFLACLLVTALGAGSPGWAAEAEPAAPAEDTSETSKPAADGQTAPSDDVFIPTEDISEDFAVSFPVDI